MKQDPRVLYCDCAYAATLSPKAKQDARQALSESRLRYDTVADLCELAASKSALLAELAGAPRLAIAACHPRAVRWLFAAAGAPLREEGVAFLDMREGPTEELLRSIRNLATAIDTATGAEGNSASPLPHLGSEAVVGADGADPGTPAWQPWFPVIDYDRCENCQLCLGFCLFGVYAAGPGGTVEVKNPAKCKTGCPACARVCPSAAIIFPKYANAPINGGEVDGSEPAVEPVQLDKATLLGGDTLQTLHDRGKRALLFSRDSDEFRALQERLRHLAEARRPLDLPPHGSSTTPPAKEST